MTLAEAIAKRQTRASKAAAAPKAKQTRATRSVKKAITEKTGTYETRNRPEYIPHEENEPIDWTNPKNEH